MQKAILILTLFLIPAAPLFAQQNDDDPFRRDPIFTRPLEDFFGIQDERDEREKEAREPEAVIRHLSVSGIDLGGSLEAGPYYSNPLYNQYPNLPMIHYNRVNGLFLGIRKERMQWHRFGSFLNIEQIEPHGFFGYGTASKSWEYAAGLEKKIGQYERLMIGGEVHRATSTEDYLRTGLTENSITSFFAAYDFMDYHQMEGFGLYAAYRTQKWVEAAFSYNRDTFRSLEQNTDFTLFGRPSVFRPNPPIDAFADEIDLDRYSIAFTFNPRKILVADRFTFSAAFGAELADNSSSDEDYRYNKYWSSLQFHYSFEPGSVLRWRLNAGGITGNAPDFKDFYLGGIGTLRGSPYKFFQGNQMLLSNIEIQFGRPSGRAGEWIRDYELHILLFLDSGWARQIDTLIDSSYPFAGFNQFSFSDLQHDAGFGIGTGAFRFELAWPLKEFGNRPGLWLRFNPTF